ncbi:hypothetical protein [Sphingomonas sp.]|uniref:hypothetical protein n=1 Tax=Sphingomonas sp. TaxID=28214 RepID=UPI002DD64E14|nr:hypothetical protein [Sphingomonas sp.]
MKGRLEARASAIGRAAVGRWRARIAARLGIVPGVTVTESGEGVVITGRRLRRRWLADARLRWIGGWL